MSSATNAQEGMRAPTFATMTLWQNPQLSTRQKPQQRSNRLYVSALQPLERDPSQRSGVVVSTRADHRRTHTPLTHARQQPLSNRFNLR